MDSSSLRASGSGQVEVIAETAAEADQTELSSDGDIISNLPSVVEASAPAFVWGENIPGKVVLEHLRKIYYEAVHWLPNVFLVPLGSTGKKFVQETNRLLRGFAEASALESVSLFALMVMPLLLLQKPCKEYSHRLRTKCLERRLEAWTEGRFDDLLLECRTIQNVLRSRRHPRHPTHEEHMNTGNEKVDARTFARLVHGGKMKSALRLLSPNGRGRVLDLNEVVPPSSAEENNHMTVLDVLKSKHPAGRPAAPEAILQGIAPETHPIVFEKLTAATIRSASLRCQGAAGPSGLDASAWKRLCSLYHGASKELCSTIAAVAKRLCTSHIKSSTLKPFVACRLVPLAKNPGVRPIGICETLRRIIGKAVMAVLGHDIQLIAGSDQLCAGQKSGCEAAVHAMHQQLENEDVEGLLFVDASNAFNALNRKLMLINLQKTCPSLSTLVTNVYRDSAEMFVGGEVLLSTEGTTQGDPLSMAVYALATLPLIQRAKLEHLTQSWFADDACSGASLSKLLAWWTVLAKEGPKYGYFPNPPKTWILVKPKYHSKAVQLFRQTGIQITVEGRPLLGAPLGCENFKKAFVENAVTKWTAEIKTLSIVAATQPQAAHAALCHGLSQKWLYITRACPGLSPTDLEPIENALRTYLLPALTGREISDIDRDVLALPARFGGLGITNPPKAVQSVSEAAALSIAPLVQLILQPSSTSVQEAFAQQRHASTTAQRQKRACLQSEVIALEAQLPSRMQKALTAAKEKGASSWLTCLPLTEYGFTLSKSEFRDAIHLRYGWTPARLPTHCVCGDTFSVDHALSCSHGGYLGLRHNEIRDLLGELLHDTCSNVCVEPALECLSGEQLRQSANTAAEARVDIKAGGFWSGNRHQCAYFDVRVFHPHARSYRHRQLTQIYRSHEQEKRRQYEERIREIDRGTFTPLVFATSGGAAPAATTFLKRLASKLAEKKTASYSQTIGWLRCRLSFALLRSAITCLRGSRRGCHQPPVPELHQPDLAIAVGQIDVRH